MSVQKWLKLRRTATKARKKVDEGRLPKSDSDFYLVNIFATELNKANSIMSSLGFLPAKPNDEKKPKTP